MSDAEAVTCRLAQVNEELRRILDMLEAIPPADPATDGERKALLERAWQLAAEVEVLLSRSRPPRSFGTRANPDSFTP